MHHPRCNVHSVRSHIQCLKTCSSSTCCDDQDAILGMLLLVLATQMEQPAWWDEVARWTYQSCRAFLEHNTEQHASKVAFNDQPQRMLKLGSCWGGWDCSNPSYHAPGHYRAFRYAAACHSHSARTHLQNAQDDPHCHLSADAPPRRLAGTLCCATPPSTAWRLQKVRSMRPSGTA